MMARESSPPRPPPNRVVIHSAPVRTPDRPHPTGQVHHQDHLVERGPEPGQPGPFHPVDEKVVDEPHGPGDIPHGRGVGDAQHPPRQFVAGQEVGVHAFGRPLHDRDADDDHRDEIDQNDSDVDPVKVEHPDLRWNNPLQYEWTKTANIRLPPSTAVAAGMITQKTGRAQARRGGFRGHNTQFSTNLRRSSISKGIEFCVPEISDGIFGLSQPVCRSCATKGIEFCVPEIQTTIFGALRAGLSVPPATRNRVQVRRRQEDGVCRTMNDSRHVIG